MTKLGKKTKSKGSVEETPVDWSSQLNLLRVAIIILAGISFSVLNTRHLSTLFENDRHFSHLADFEREMTYRTEMGLYYSYYKTIINAPSFISGLQEITHDNVTEYGHTINTLKRFNLYPEVILSFAYRQFKTLTNVFGWRLERCWTVNRGELDPVDSCEGIGNPHYFYIDHVFALAGTTAGWIFVLGILVSDTIFGGLISVLAFAFNHGEATRVQWTPPLRESFAFPVIVAQIALVTYILKNQHAGAIYAFGMAFLGMLAMLFWQFSQFAFFTQVGSLFVVYTLDFISPTTMRILLTAHFAAFVSAFILLFGNEMLLTSLYLASIIAALLLVYLDPILNKLSFRPLYVILTASSFVSATVAIKFGIARLLQIEDDAHIFDLLRSKFSNYATFHTRLYTCSAEFDFIAFETLQKLCDTWLIPCASLGVLTFIIYFFFTERSTMLWRDNEREKDHAEVFYNVVQCFCYAVMALLIMRLKLFMTPHLCICCAILANNEIFRSINIRIDKRIHAVLIVAVIAAMAYEGKSNIEKQLRIKGEYSNPEQEMLFDWIVRRTKPDDVFAGTMPVMANVKLSTLRPIVNHPHYEDVGIRDRTKKVYSVFSKKPLREVHQTLKKMGVNYVVFQLFNCAPEPNRPYCAYRGMWDEEDKENINRVSNCDLYNVAVTQKDPSVIHPFSIAYTRNNNYVVLKV
ncbi:unnamed protein product [Cylicocyclus nassatus]|uniref:C-mannosyltransferase dpy-19 n=1 Tax=Cylicocyclus nassatus TaxID=53992 RepID=A0AA36M5I6_CYLNA|nr:unnamed protein product [Cylicocyclus nassatus]